MVTKAYSNKALPAGTVLREWRLEQVLGVGGFGIVYKGRGIYFDELVAIKEYFPSAISDRRDGDTVVPNDSESEEIHALGLKKFVEEAKLLWNLSKPTRHPNIVSVRSLFEIHGTAYMVMDFEDGLSLSDMLKTGKRFNEPSLMALIRPIAEGLDRAHRVGVLHRDIKPPNILVSSSDGRPVLIDFGSARFDSGKATSTKVTFHTPPYAAIEQYVKTYEQGPWTDIYALGVVLYECVTGEKPPEVLERLHGGLGKPLADSDWPGYSPKFLRAIDTGMIIRPSDRPQTITQWLAMFDAADDAPPHVFAAADHDDAPTRFASFQTLPEAIAPAAPPPPVAAPPPPAVPDDPAEVEIRMPDQRAEGERPLNVIAEPEALADPVRPAPAPPAASPPEQKRSGIRSIPLVVAGAAAIGITAGGYYLATQIDALTKLRSIASPSVAPADQPEATNSTAAIDTSTVNDLPGALQALALEARKAGAPSVAVQETADAGRRLDALATELAGLGGKPDQAGTAAARADEMASLAKSASAELAAAIAQQADGKIANLARDLPWANPRLPNAAASEPAHRQTIAGSLRRAERRLQSAAAEARSAADAGQAIAAARRTVSASTQFASASAKAYSAPATMPVVETAAIDTPVPASETVASPSSSASSSSSSGEGIPAKIDAFKSIESSAKSIAKKVIDLGKSARPGGSATDEAREAYRVRQDNATRAQGYVDHLDILSRSMRGANTEQAADRIITQASTVRSYLTTLLLRSNASMPKKK